MSLKYDQLVVSYGKRERERIPMRKKQWLSLSLLVSLSLLAAQCGPGAPSSAGTTQPTKSAGKIEGFDGTKRPIRKLPLPGFPKP
jgi:hypothetical protein